MLFTIVCAKLGGGHTREFRHLGRPFHSPKGAAKAQRTPAHQKLSGLNKSRLLTYLHNVCHIPASTLLRLPRAADAAAHLLHACATAGGWPHQQPPEWRPTHHVGHPVSTVLLVVGVQRLFWQCEFGSQAWGSRATPGACGVVDSVCTDCPDNLVHAAQRPQP